MSEPTEAEIEAAVIAVLTANYGAANVKKFWPDDLASLVSGPPFSAEEWRSDMRAALTAAAQVRERGESAQKERLRAALTEAIDIAFGTDLNRQAVERLRELERLAAGEPTLMPIYSAAENPPAELSDIVVQCKCGWRGKQSDTVWASTTTTTYHCPKCGSRFFAWPAVVVLNERPNSPDPTRAP